LNPRAILFVALATGWLFGSLQTLASEVRVGPPREPHVLIEDYRRSCEHPDDLAELTFLRKGQAPLSELFCSAQPATAQLAEDRSGRVYALLQYTRTIPLGRDRYLRILRPNGDELVAVAEIRLSFATDSSDRADFDTVAVRPARQGLALALSAAAPSSTKSPAVAKRRTIRIKPASRRHKKPRNVLWDAAGKVEVRAPFSGYIDTEGWCGEFWPGDSIIVTLRREGEEPAHVRLCSSHGHAEARVVSGKDGKTFGLLEHSEGRGNDVRDFLTILEPSHGVLEDVITLPLQWQTGFDAAFAYSYVVDMTDGISLRLNGKAYSKGECCIPPETDFVVQVR
jgi:hypothetical protein